MFDERLFKRRLGGLAQGFLRKVDEPDRRFLAKKRRGDVRDLNDLLRHLPAPGQDKSDRGDRHDRSCRAVGELTLPHLTH